MQKKDIKVLKSELEELNKDKDNTELKIKDIREKYNNTLSEKNNILEKIKKKDLLSTTLKNKISVLENNLSVDASTPSSVKNILNSRSLKGIHSTVGKILDTEIVESSSKNIVFSNANPVPGTVVVTGASSTYTNGTLTLSSSSDI